MPRWLAPSLANAAPLPTDTLGLAVEGYQRLDLNGSGFRVRANGAVSLADRPVAIVPLDDTTPDRLEAIIRFWQTLHRPPAATDPRVTPQRRSRLRQMLRTVDARTERASYRSIAGALFPRHQIESASWAGDAVRETTIRLARDGLKLVHGGYRTLLTRPRKS
ncbi:DUF2285 domain-containing protein [Agrobacterium vitis]|uniref:DUF2285 domain-containing protein n=1 Tax=Agrobacterium vitis TaxID=373 RepID=UPI0012E7830C|nr:DUF2285 domain-containing protein [Agrobacterium vitis]MUZ65674.1 DUF2285 domain-containing protein [Agrobacterium vitis]